MIDIDAIRQRAQAATKGPWTGEVYRSVLAGLATSTGNHGADAAFVRDARTDVPALLAKVDELTAALAERDAQLAKSRTQAAKFDDEVSTLTVEMGRDRTDRDRAAKTVDTLRDYILGAIKGDGLDAAEMHDIAGDLATVLGHLGHPVANEDGCDCESYDCKGQCCGVGNCTCTPARPIVTVELPSEVAR